MFGLSAQTSLHSPLLLSLTLWHAMQYIAPAIMATETSTTNTSKRIPLLLFSTAFQTLAIKPVKLGRKTRQKNPAENPAEKPGRKTFVFLVVYFTLIF